MYFILKDFRSYAEAQKRVEEAYRDQQRWSRMAMMQTACSGKFSSDRTIEEYVRDIWHLEKVEVPFEYDYPVNHGNGGNAAVTLILTIYLIALALIIAVALASYIFHSIGLYTIGKRMGREHAWLAFVPFARDYFHGELAGEIHLKNKSIRNPGIWKLVLPIIYGAVAGVLMVFLFVAALGAGAVSTLNGSQMGGVMAFSTTLIVLYILILVLVVAYSAVYSVLRILIDIQIYEKFTTRNMAVVHSVLSGLIPLYEAICFFVMRNKTFNPGMEPRITPPPVPPVYPGGPAAGGPLPGGPAQENPENKTE